MLTRQDITQAVVAALEPHEFIYAIWEGGSAAFNRADQWSDIDLQVDVADEQVAQVFELVEAALTSLAPLELKYEIPQPAWHGHHQTFYRLQGAPPWLFLDLAVIKHSAANKFLEPEIHGQAIFYLDRANVAASPTPLDRDALAQRLKARVASSRQMFELFQVLVSKEVWRGNPIDALAFYHSLTLRPLVELLRIKYDPTRHNFGPRYLYVTLPPEVAARLERLYFPVERADIEVKRSAAAEWFMALADELSGA